METLSSFLNFLALQETYAQIVKDFYIKEMETPVSSYDQEYLKKTTPDDSSK
jgi:mRNA deadenylase 3'-5' endonuclease subunit Ccr4